MPDTHVHKFVCFSLVTLSFIQIQDPRKPRRVKGKINFLFYSLLGKSYVFLVCYILKLALFLVQEEVTLKGSSKASFVYPLADT